MESTGGCDPVMTVNGQSYASHDSPNTNFALLVSTSFTEPFHEPIAYGKYVARLANMLSAGCWYRDWATSWAAGAPRRKNCWRARAPHPCRGCTRGPELRAAYRHLTDLREMIFAMEWLAPGVASPDTLLYGVEVKFYSSRPKVSAALETELPASLPSRRSRHKPRAHPGFGLRRHRRPRSPAPART